MDNIKINALDNTTTVTDNDLLVIETSLGTRSIKVKKFLSGVYEVLNKCFQSVSNGKSLVASAITDKGVETASDATFAVMSDNISKIGGHSMSFCYGMYNYLPICGGVGFAGLYTATEE